MDEKGPQNSFKISYPFDEHNKLSYADDNMYSYVANVIQIDKKDYESIEEEYERLVEEYLSYRPQLRKSLSDKKEELKGQDLLRKNFNFGIASMKNKEIRFYFRLLEVLLKYDVDNLLFMISKVSIITSSRLTNFFYFLDVKTIYSPFICKYIITKYVEVEASEKVVKAFLDKSCSTKNLLEQVRDDMMQIILKNIDNQRMMKQVDSYKHCIEAINGYVDNDLILNEPNIPVSFDWTKVRWAFDLWMTELNFQGNEKKYKLFLDEGIPKDIFENLNFNEINENCNSKDYIGLQITDMLVVLIGKLISQLITITKYDFNKPELRVLVGESYFNLTEEQFYLIKKLEMFVLGSEGQYHFINDAYFDASVLLQSYLQYVSSFNDFDSYKELDANYHAESHMLKFIDISELKYIDAIKTESLVKEIFDSLKSGVEAGIFRPL